MKILFYLPVITRWWFDEIVAPMLRTLHPVAELHVIVAPMWRSTGLCGEELAAVADLDRINWHVVDAEQGPAFRTNAAAVPGLLDLVERIAPDLTLCRSAEQATPSRFPGTVRFIMEGAAAPFETDLHWIVLEQSLFAYGAMPTGAAALGARCADVLSPLWQRAAQRLAFEPERGWRAHFGIPQDRPVLCVPLQYEHEEDLFVDYSGFPHAVDLLGHLLATVPADTFLAITDHPLNRRFVDRRGVDGLIAAHPDRAMLCQDDALPSGPTALLATHADAVLVDQSKSWSLAAFSGTPIVHVGNTPLAGWMHASRDLAHFPVELQRPDRAGARNWFGWHLGTRILDARFFDLDDLMARVAGTPDDAMIAANLDRVLGQPLKVAA